MGGLSLITCYEYNYSCGVFIPMARKQNHLKRISKRFKNATRNKQFIRTESYESQKGFGKVVRDKDSHEYKTVQSTKGKQKVYRTSKPLI
ncbi:hypothetical protein [Vibrio phage vB_VpP_BA6]|nr:hypothetical protein [Vibrio phage vB_VpP_BA6]